MANYKTASNFQITPFIAQRWLQSIVWLQMILNK